MPRQKLDARRLAEEGIVHGAEAGREDVEVVGVRGVRAGLPVEREEAEPDLRDDAAGRVLAHLGIALAAVVEQTTYSG